MVKLKGEKSCQGLHSHTDGSPEVGQLFGNSLADFERSGCRGGWGIADMEGVFALKKEKIIDELAIRHQGLGTNSCMTGNQVFGTDFWDQPLQTFEEQL